MQVVLLMAVVERSESKAVYRIAPVSNNERIKREGMCGQRGVVEINTKAGILHTYYSIYPDLPPFGPPVL